MARLVDALLEQRRHVEPEPISSAADRSSPEASAADPPRTVAVGADHGGFRLKHLLVGRLRDAGYDVVDCGTDSPEAVDYPEIAHAVARRVAEGAAGRGIIVDGAGIGSAMVANKVPGVRAAPCYDLSSARNSQEHNHANILTLGASLIGDELAWQIVEEWLAVEWAGADMRDAST